jgi:hypothetical protein
MYSCTSACLGSIDLKVDCQVSFVHKMSKTAFIWLEFKLFIEEGRLSHALMGVVDHGINQRLLGAHIQSSRFCCGDQAASGSARADSAQASAAGLERLCHRHTPRVKVFLDARCAAPMLFLLNNPDRFLPRESVYKCMM